MSEHSLRILIFAHDASMYGASRSLLTLIKEWKNRKEITIKVLLPGTGKMEEDLQSMGINYEVIAYPLCVYKQKGSLLNTIKTHYSYRKASNKVSKAIALSVKEFSPHILYTNTSVVKEGYKFSRLLKLPHVWHVREFGWDDYKLKYIPDQGTIKKQVQRSQSIFASRALQQFWLENSTTKGNVIYNGLLDCFNKAVPRKLTGQSINIGLLGAIMPGKGQAVAVKAVAILKNKFPNIQLGIYGGTFDHDYHREISQLIKTLDVNDAVSLVGFIDDVEEVYSEMNILLNCSANEGFGRTIVEAMARGIPVVANNAGGIPEIIDDKVNGLLYHLTAQDLADKIAALLSDPVLYERLSANAIKKANAKFTTAEYSDAVYTVLESTAKNRVVNGRTNFE